MSSKLAFLLRILIFCNILALLPGLSTAQNQPSTLTQVCTPKVTANIVVASAKQRFDAGQRAQPPITDTFSGFAGPDTPMGVLKTANGYEFFASDGGSHSRQLWRGQYGGNNKSGSVVTTFGPLDNPLGLGRPQGVSGSPETG